MKLRTKILAGYGVALTLVVLVCGWGVVNLHRLGRASEAILRENYRSILAAENMLDSLERQDSATLLVLLGDEEKGTEQFRANEVVFLQWLGRAQDNVTIAGEKEILLILEDNYEDYLLVFSQLPRRQPTQTSLSRNYYYQRVLPSFELVRQTCIELRELNQQTMLDASQKAQALSHQAIWSMIAAGVAAAGLGLTFSLLLSTRLVRPLRQMTRATGRIAEGDYDVAIAVTSEDELGLLAQGITRMSQNLKVFHELNVGQVIAEKQRNEAIIRSISDGLVVVDSSFGAAPLELTDAAKGEYAELKIIAINPTAAAILNTTPERARGSHFLDVINHQQLYEYIKTTAQTGKPPQLSENQSILSKETENEYQAQYYNFVITPVTTEEGAMLGVVLLLQDVTKLKELDRLKSEFVATASHELRTPLTGMAMSLNLLLETTQQKLTERELELLQAAAEDVERLRALVNDLLDLSKIESGRIEMELVSVEAGLLIEKAVSMLSVQAQEKQIELTQQVPTAIESVKADPNKITWVLTNLIANALRYTEAGGHIRVTAQQRGDWVYLSVSDDGPGIAWEYQAKIFDKFVQVKTDKDVGGSGLGLAICKEIVKAHGGTIWVDSIPSQGSTFTFTLPVFADLLNS